MSKAKSEQKLTPLGKSLQALNEEIKKLETLLEIPTKEDTPVIDNQKWEIQSAIAQVRQKSPGGEETVLSKNLEAHLAKVEKFLKKDIPLYREIGPVMWGNIYKSGKLNNKLVALKKATDVFIEDEELKASMSQYTSSELSLAKRSAVFYRRKCKEESTFNKDSGGFYSDNEKLYRNRRYKI